MADINKPDMTNIWASGGAMIAPSPVKIQTGWVAEIPPHQWENWAQNRQDMALAYLFQKGIPEWDVSLEYIGNKSYVQKSGTIYKCIATNTGDDPEASPSSWEKNLGIEVGVKSVSFSDVINKTSDEGPLIVHDMCGTAWTWEESQYFSGYRSKRCGEWLDGWTPTPLAFQILAVGGTWRESDEKERRVIARYRESGLVVPSAQWMEGQNMISDQGNGNWKAPDLRDMFKRMTGTDVDTANARLLGEFQSDAFQSHSQRLRSHGGTEYVQYINLQTTTGLAMSVPVTSGGVNGLITTGDFISYGTGGAPRVSSETRASSCAVAPFIHV